MYSRRHRTFPTYLIFCVCFRFMFILMQHHQYVFMRSFKINKNISKCIHKVPIYSSINEILANKFLVFQLPGTSSWTCSIYESKEYETFARVLYVPILSASLTRILFIGKYNCHSLNCKLSGIIEFKKKNSLTFYTYIKFTNWI